MILWTWSCTHDPVNMILYTWSCKHDHVHMILWTWSCTHDPVHMILWTRSCEHDPLYMIHSILLNRLSTSFGIQGSALAWLTSYLSDRSQTIRVGSAASGPSNCQSGVPQGSVLGPILFSLYISPLGHIISSFNISHQQYADDSQFYISLVADSIRASLDRFEACLSAVRSWLCTNGLCLNPDKSDSIILGTHQRLRTFPAIPSVKIADIDINISNEITSLGVIMDSKLTLDSHISAICKSCYYHLRSLRHLRRSLTQDMTISVAVAIVQSRLDYCNSLLYDISTFNISKLQRVQNLAARLALNDWHFPSHVLVSKLHWLPVLSRIKFKISSLTYKLLNDHKPGYLNFLISLYTPCSFT